MCDSRSCIGGRAGRGSAAHAHNSVCCADVVLRKVRDPSFGTGLPPASLSHTPCYLPVSGFCDHEALVHQVAGAMCTVLASVLGRVPAQILRSRFNASVQIMQSIVEQNDQQVYIHRAPLILQPSHTITMALVQSVADMPFWTTSTGWDVESSFSMLELYHSSSEPHRVGPRVAPVYTAAAVQHRR